MPYPARKLALVSQYGQAIDVQLEAMADGSQGDPPPQAATHLLADGLAELASARSGYSHMLPSGCVRPIPYRLDLHVDLQQVDGLPDGAANHASLFGCAVSKGSRKSTNLH
jgi:hypothetical protein